MEPSPETIRSFNLAFWKKQKSPQGGSTQGLCGEDTHAMTGNLMEILEQKAVSEPGFHEAELGVALDSEDIWEPRCTSSKALLWRLLVRVTQLSVLSPFPEHFPTIS